MGPQRPGAEGVGQKREPARAEEAPGGQQLKGPRAEPGRAPGLGRAPGEARRARGQRGRVQRGRKNGHGPRLRADVRAWKALGAGLRSGRGPEGPDAGGAEGHKGLAPTKWARTRASQGPRGPRKGRSSGTRGPSPAARPARAARRGGPRPRSHGGPKARGFDARGKRHVPEARNRRRAPPGLRAGRGPEGLKAKGARRPKESKEADVDL